MMRLDAVDPAAQLTNNTRHMLSRLGVGVGGDGNSAGTMPRYPEGGTTEGTAHPKWHQHQHQHQGGGELEEEQRNTGLNENGVDTEYVGEGSCRGGYGGVKFQKELARAFRVAMRDDKRLKTRMAGIASRALKESRQEQVIIELLSLPPLITPCSPSPRWRRPWRQTPAWRSWTVIGPALPSAFTLSAQRQLLTMFVAVWCTHAVLGYI